MWGLLYGAPGGEGTAYQLQWLYRGRDSGHALLGAISSGLDELDRQAHEILQKEFPDDEDIPGLALTDITIDKSGCYGTFSLCYDTGDSPAGELYLNVSFDEQFVPSPKVGYDTF